MSNGRQQITLEVWELRYREKIITVDLPTLEEIRTKGNMITAFQFLGESGGVAVKHFLGTGRSQSTRG